MVCTETVVIFVLFLALGAFPDRSRASDPPSSEVSDPPEVAFDAADDGQTGGEVDDPYDDAPGGDASNMSAPKEKRVDEGKLIKFSRLSDDAANSPLADEVPAVQQDSSRMRHRTDIPAALLVAISAFALVTALAIALVSILYHRRQSSGLSAQSDPRSSFYAVENEPRAWDSLSFSQSITDLTNCKVQFQSWESLSDDSYINSLDEVISQKASIITSGKKNRTVSRAQTASATRGSVLPATDVTAGGGGSSDELKPQ